MDNPKNELELRSN